MELLGGRCKGHVSTARVGPARLTIARIKRTTLKAAAGTAASLPHSLVNPTQNLKEIPIITTPRGLRFHQATNIVARPR